MLVAPRPDYLITAGERIISERIARLERMVASAGASVPGDAAARIKRLRGVLDWNIQTEYDRRFTDAHKNLRKLNRELGLLKRQYTAFVRTRQAATQSYEGYDEAIRRQRTRIQAAREKVRVLSERQGQMLESMAVNELTKRRDRLAEFQLKARFAMADSYDRATKDQRKKKVGQ